MMTNSLILRHQLILGYMLYAIPALLAYHAYGNPCQDNSDAHAGANRLWPNGIIPYYMSTSLSKNVSLATMIGKEIQQWELHSCINFIPRVGSNSRCFLFFILGDKNRTKVNSGGIEARLCESVSTNQTALRVIFAKMIGIRNLTVLTKSYGIETKKSNHSVTLTVAQRNNTLCHQIKKCGYTYNISNDNRQHVFTSPGYPGGYERNLDCVWSIYNTKRRPVNISFEESLLEDLGGHCGDFVKIILINEEGKPIDDRELCKDLPGVIPTTDAYKIAIWFHSNKHSTTDSSEKGFKAKIAWGEVLSIDECTLMNGECEHVCIPASQTSSISRKCECKPGFELSKKDETSCSDINECLVNNGGCTQRCVNTIGGYRCECRLGFLLIPATHGKLATDCKECEKTYTNRKNVTIHPVFLPGVYSAHHNCQWKIVTTEPQFYLLNITYFDLKNSSNCSAGYLKITDKTNKLKLPKLCGKDIKILIAGRTAELKVRFKTKGEGGNGFKVIYSQQVGTKLRYIQIDDKRIEGTTYNHTIFDL